ncbi:MAG: hypothetical protein H7Z39_07515 [Burkholderiaceae bacterium]|nr:hypothetical protein [Burkholderiaceae bacterium]
MTRASPRPSACPPAHKVAVLARLFAHGLPREIALHEPSLEDLFLGGRHVRDN